MANLGMAAKIAKLKPDVVHLSSCLVSSSPGSPYFKAEKLAALIEKKTWFKITLGTHDYHCSPLLQAQPISDWQMEEAESPMCPVSANGTVWQSRWSVLTNGENVTSVGWIYSWSLPYLICTLNLPVQRQH